MKWYGAAFILVLFTGAVCNNKTGTDCFKGKLMIMGICMNYVIEVLEGDRSRLSPSETWTDESNGRVYRNVFTLGNKCNFPDMQEGAAFYFTLDANTNNDCAVCEAYRPVPVDKNNITIVQKPCL